MSYRLQQPKKTATYAVPYVEWDIQTQSGSERNYDIFDFSMGDVTGLDITATISGRIADSDPVKPFGSDAVDGSHFRTVEADGDLVTTSYSIRYSYNRIRVVVDGLTEGQEVDFYLVCRG